MIPFHFVVLQLLYVSPLYFLHTNNVEFKLSSCLSCVVKSNFFHTTGRGEVFSKLCTVNLQNIHILDLLKQSSVFIENHWSDVYFMWLYVFWSFVRSFLHKLSGFVVFPKIVVLLLYLLGCDVRVFVYVCVFVSSVLRIGKA